MNRATNEEIAYFEGLLLTLKNKRLGVQSRRESSIFSGMDKEYVLLEKQIVSAIIQTKQIISFLRRWG